MSLTDSSFCCCCCCVCHFLPVSDRVDFPGEEEKILHYWDKISAFQTSLANNADKPPFTFYDGPPFATGLPHYGHILAGTIKDVVTRYASQTGFYVSRRFGWDWYTTRQHSHCLAQHRC